MKTTRSLSSIALAASMAVGPAVAYAKDPPVMVGQGAHTYEWVKNWLKVPLPGMFIGPTHGDVVIDSKDHIYFSTETANSLYTVQTDGRILHVGGWPFSAGAHGLRLVKDGAREVIWMTHTGRHEVLKLSLEGELLMTLKYPDKVSAYKEAKEYLPTAVDVGPNGDVYVVDGYGKGWAHQWNAKGEYVRSWDGSDGKAGKFHQPHGIGVDLRGAEPRLVIADRLNHRLQLFTLEGRYIDEVHEDLRKPSKIVTRGDDLLIVDLEGRITIFDKAYKVVAQLGDNSNPDFRGKFDVGPESWKDGEFIAPHGAAWDSKGNLYVTEYNKAGRINKLLRAKTKK